MINACLFMDMHQNIYSYPSGTVLQSLIEGGTTLYSALNLEDSPHKASFFSLLCGILVAAAETRRDRSKKGGDSAQLPAP